MHHSPPVTFSGPVATSVEKEEDRPSLPSNSSHDVQEGNNNTNINHVKNNNNNDYSNNNNDNLMNEIDNLLRSERNKFEEGISNTKQDHQSTFPILTMATHNING